MRKIISILTLVVFLASMKSSAQNQKPAEKNKKECSAEEMKKCKKDKKDKKTCNAEEMKKCSKEKKAGCCAAKPKS